MVGRRVAALSLVASLALAACSGSDGPDVDVDVDVDVDDAPSTIGGINGPAVVDPSFDPFATVPSAPTPTDGG